MYLEEKNGKVSRAKFEFCFYNSNNIPSEKYIYDTKKEFLNACSIEEFNFDFDNAYEDILTYDEFGKITLENNHFHKIYEKDDAITEKGEYIVYTYDENDKLIAKESRINTKKYNSTNPELEVITEKIHHTIYSYTPTGLLRRKESYIKGEEIEKGIDVEEYEYDEKGNEIRSYTYNTKDTSSKFYTERK